MSAADIVHAVDPNSQEALDALRHSCAHVMAQAVQELFPGTKIAIGPSIENGFYYDFDTPHRFSEVDFLPIQKRMLQIAESNVPFVGKEVTYDESKAYWAGKGEPYKLELLEGFRGVGIDGVDDVGGGHHIGSWDKKMVPSTGFEPVTFPMSRERATTAPTGLKRRDDATILSCPAGTNQIRAGQRGRPLASRSKFPYVQPAGPLTAVVVVTPSPAASSVSANA